MRRERKRNHTIFDRSGITLIELLIALTVFGIMAGAIYRVFVAQARAYAIQDQVVEVQQDIRGAMELMLRDLRMAGFQTSTFNSALITTTPIVTPLSDSSITVNYEYLGGANPITYTVTYALQGGNLNYTLTETPAVGAPIPHPTETILRNVNGLTFTYGVDQDQDGTQDDLNNDNDIDAADFLTTANANPLGARIVAVRVDLTAAPAPVNPDVTEMVSPRRLTSSVFMRNMSFKTAQEY